MPDPFVEVVFPVPLRQVFTYHVPPALLGLVRPGMRCYAPFGRRRTVGIVVGPASQAPPKGMVLKDLESLLDAEPSLTPDLLSLGRWMADYYHGSLGEALFAMLPTGYRRTPKALLALKPGVAEEAVEEVLERIGKLRGVTFEALEGGRVPLTKRTQKLAALLKEEGLGEVRFGEEAPNRGTSAKVPKGPAAPELHPQQAKALEAILQSLTLSTFHTFLLHGVTGSGKTEVYLRAIERTLAVGRQAVVLIPEIALTPQTVERFTGRFGDKVAVLHSRLSTGERTAEWRRLATGEARVAVGARSALFAPVKELGLIVVDEEQESSYKQEDAPRYHARDAAVKRAQLCGAVALLGSATPSLESVHNAQSGKYTLLILPERVNRRPLPEVKVLDLKEEWTIRGSDRPILSLALETALKNALERGEQAILFLNRRGFSTLTLCEKCGENVTCPHCSIPVTHHRGGDPRKVLLCHYCNWQGPIPTKCPACKDGDIRQVGLGTEKVEEELKTKFPRARIGRMDLDTTRKKGSHGEILGKFRRGEFDLLVGTQMIAKGHDFPGVTLVGVVGADVGLNLPDFRASERVFQLMVQVAGRAGRAEKEGVVYLQTFHPDSPAIRAAALHDTEAFWKEELELRKALSYPPFSRLGLLVYRHKTERKAYEAAEAAANYLEREGPKQNVGVRGPAPCPIFKLRGQYRFQILLSCAQPGPIRRLLDALDAKVQTPSGVQRVVDLDPQSML